MPSKRMPGKLQALVFMGLKTVGKKDCLGYIEEQLTPSEYENVKGFLDYLEKNNLTVGYGNVDERWSSYKAAT